MKKITDKVKFFIVSIELLVSSSSVWLILAAFGSEEDMNDWGYIAGGMFWVGLVGGILSYHLFFRKKYPGTGRLKFFSNKVAKIADIALCVFFVMFIVCMQMASISKEIGVLVIFCLLTSIYARFLLNGNAFINIFSNTLKERGAKQE